MFHFNATNTTVALDQAGRPREVRTAGERIPVTRLESIRDEIRCLSAGVRATAGLRRRGIGSPLSTRPSAAETALDGRRVGRPGGKSPRGGRLKRTREPAVPVKGTRVSCENATDE